MIKNAAVTPRFLVTTALQSTWSVNEPVLFLGEWCKLYTEKNKWEHLDAEVAPYFWDDRQMFEKDYIYIRELSEKVLLVLQERLNDVHKTNHTLRYWRIIAGPWLNLFIAMAYERWTQLKSVEAEYAISGVYVADAPDSVFTPLDTCLLIELLISDEWNCWIYSFIIKNYSSLAWKEKPITPLLQQGQQPEKKSRREKIKNFITGLFNRHKATVITGAGLTQDIYLKLMLRYGYVATQLPESGVMNTTPDISVRKQLFAGQKTHNKGFEDCLWDLIALQLPVSFVENFHFHTANAEKLPLPRKPRQILTTNVYYHEDFRFWLADRLTVSGSKAKLLLLQHGGSYGIMRYFANQDYEMKIADQFLTWGWTSDQKNVIPLGMVKGSPFSPRTLYDQPYALLISRSFPRQSYKLASEPISSQILSYYNDHFRFIDCLELHIRYALQIRLYPVDFGWNELFRFMERFPDVTIAPSGKSLESLSKQSRIIIVTYNSTSFLETLSLNIPTLIYWDPTYNELDSDVIPYFIDLKRVGIFHETPESAAQLLSRVWDNISSWWQNEELQQVVNIFSERFCYIPSKPAKCIAEKLIEDIK